MSEIFVLIFNNRGIIKVETSDNYEELYAVMEQNYRKHRSDEPVNMCFIEKYGAMLCNGNNTYTWRILPISENKPIREITRKE